jgi:hypothetical protein
MYRLVVTVNPAGWFLESNYSNNVGWASFELTRDDKGEPSVKETNFSNAGIWFDEYGTLNPYPTVSPYPTLTFTFLSQSCDWRELSDVRYVEFSIHDGALVVYLPQISNNTPHFLNAATASPSSFCHCRMLLSSSSSTSSSAARHGFVMQQ